MKKNDTTIQEDGFGFAPSSVNAHLEGNPFKIVRRYTLTNKNGASVRLITWGAGIQSIRVPNNKGVLGDVALGFDNIDGYLQNRCIGRITNRIAIGTKQNQNSLSKNRDQLFHINEGFDGLDNVNWESYVLDKQVIMSYLRRVEGCRGYTLIQAKYSWTDENELDVNICASATGTLPANMTSYCPMNLAGHGMAAQELKNHVVTINADKWISLSTRNNLSTATRRNVECTLYDLRKPTQLKNKLRMIPGGGYDHNLCINSPSRWCYRFHARVLHPDSGRFLEVYSDQPELQFCTLNNLPDHMWGGCDKVPVEKQQMDENETVQKVKEIRGKDGVLYRRHGGFVLSPQSKPARVLWPGKVFEHNMTYKFGVRSKNE